MYLKRQRKLGMASSFAVFSFVYLVPYSNFNRAIDDSIRYCCIEFSLPGTVHSLHCKWTLSKRWKLLPRQREFKRENFKLVKKQKQRIRHGWSSINVSIYRCCWYFRLTFFPVLEAFCRKFLLMTWQFFILVCRIVSHPPFVRLYVQFTVHSHIFISISEVKSGWKFNNELWVR